MSSQLHLGGRYFAIRERTSQVIAGIRQLARETGTVLAEDLSETSARENPTAPFLFLVCGEVNAGKSTLINSLFETELCEVSSLPKTSQIVHYRYGASQQEVRKTEVLEERYRPLHFLRNFHVLDTVGTNKFTKDHEEMVGQIFSLADLLLFVFPVTNPWCAATWNLISRIPEDCRKQIVLILQQADKKDDADIEVILRHVSDLAIKRIGSVPQIFAVSAKNAFQAKAAENRQSKDLEKSGFSAFENFISSEVCNSPTRKKALHTWRTQAASALTQIEENIEEQTRILSDQNSFLASLEAEIDTMRETLVTRLPSHLDKVANTFQKEAIVVSKSLQKSLTVPRSLVKIFIGDVTGSQIEGLFMDRLRKTVERVAESDGRDVVIACQDHWKELGDRVKEAIHTEIDNREPVTEKLEQASQRFVLRIGRAADHAIENLHVKKILERDLRKRNRALKSFTATTLILLIFGASCGILGFLWAPWAFCGIAAIFFAGGAIIAMITKGRIARDFQDSLLNTCGSFAETLRTDYEEALHLFFQDYKTCLNSVRKHLANEKLAIEPRLARWHELFLSLKSIEQDS